MSLLVASHHFRWTYTPSLLLTTSAPGSEISSRNSCLLCDVFETASFLTANALMNQNLSGHTAGFWRWDKSQVLLSTWLAKPQCQGLLYYESRFFCLQNKTSHLYLHSSLRSPVFAWNFFYQGPPSLANFAFSLLSLRSHARRRLGSSDEQSPAIAILWENLASALVFTACSVELGRVYHID